MHLSTLTFGLSVMWIVIALFAYNPVQAMNYAILFSAVAFIQLSIEFHASVD